MGCSVSTLTLLKGGVLVGKLQDKTRGANMHFWGCMLPDHLCVTGKHLFESNSFIWFLWVWKRGFNCSNGWKGVRPQRGGHSCGVEDMTCWHQCHKCAAMCANFAHVLTR